MLISEVNRVARKERPPIDAVCHCHCHCPVTRGESQGDSPTAILLPPCQDPSPVDRR